MSYKPDQNDWMAYLYGEMESADKEKMEQYLLANADARKELEWYKKLQGMLSTVEDKEVIAPPLVLGEGGQRFIWNTPSFRLIAGIAASFLVVILVGKATGLRVVVKDNEFTMAFGEPKPAPVQVAVRETSLTPEQVQQMINASLNENNEVMRESWAETQQKLDASVRTSLAMNSGKIDKLVREAATASQQQIQQYVSGMQADNMKLVKDYFQLSSTQQKDYIENLLVDFAKYLQQERNSDLQVVQSRLNAIEQNTDVFKQETEQILSSIITTVGNNNAVQSKY